MFEKLLTDLIGKRRVEEMTTKEASALVNEYYTRVILKTLGWACQEKVYILADRALKNAGLEFFC